jgi:hypothetical protein
MDYLTNYYKNLSEQLQAKYRRLLNEAEGPFGVESPLSAGGIGDDPNLRGIGGYEQFDLLSARQSVAFNPTNQNWSARIFLSSGNNQSWSDFINSFYTNWNNQGFWNNMYELIEFLFPLESLEYLPNGNIVVTEQHKNAIWQLMGNMANFANAFTGQPGPGNQSWYNGLNNIMRQSQSANGGSGSVNQVPWLNPSRTNWQALVGIGGFPTTHPSSWSPGQNLPFGKQQSTGNNFAAIQTASTSTPSQPNSPSNRPRRPTESFGPGPGRRPTKGSQGRRPGSFGGGAGPSAPRPR